MRSDRSAEVQSALQLIRVGRFTAAVEALRGRFAGSTVSETNALAQSILADALQRTGKNDLAQSIASRCLGLRSAVPEIRARCHFVLGNVRREQGNVGGAIEHFRMAVTSHGSNLELSCWAQLRLMTSVAELDGAQAAIARLEDVRRTLTRFGDPRPFAALHLWLAEMESTRGNLKRARRHLGAAQTLLAHEDDVWLQGYLAINSSGVSYYCAEISEARRWAELAIAYARTSGHLGARRAAHANIGQIEFSAGHLTQAEKYFRTALECCEVGSAHEIAILDSMAQLKLCDGNLDDCRSILDKIDEIAARFDHSRPQHYTTWPLQTRIRLLLKEGRTREASRLSQKLTPPIKETPQSRTTTASYLLASETLIALDKLDGAVSSLSPLLSPPIQLPPDLFAERERLVGSIFVACQATELGRVQLNRALRAFDTIGHSIGKESVRTDLTSLANADTTSYSEHIPVMSSLIRVCALLDTRTQPELFGHEAASFLNELGCAEAISVGRKDGGAPQLDVPHTSRDLDTTSPRVVSIDLGGVAGEQMSLSFVPRRDPVSFTCTLYFERAVKQILALEPPESTLGDCDIVWSANDWSSATGVVFAAESMFAILKTVKAVASTDVSVLITGETGTGKEVIARSIHEQSTRAKMPFVALNCAAIPRELLESQLFGYRKGAFSGATEPFQGVIRAASGGTLLLDEIGEIPLDMQAKLLRFLELGEIHAMGEAQPSKVNVRLVFATNDDLEEAVRRHEFREDLFYRLNVVPIKVPPLRERREEIPLLIGLFSQRFAREFSKEPMRFSDSAMELLVFYSWPGNVRQLGNEVRRLAALLDSAAYVTPDHLSNYLSRQESERPPVPVYPQVTVRLDQSLELATACLEREMIEQALKVTHGRVAAAAASLGLSRKGLYLKRRRLGLVR